MVAFVRLKVQVNGVVNGVDVSTRSCMFLRDEKEQGRGNLNSRLVWFVDLNVTHD